ncbi:MAG TPA: FtsX-like permease family protein [Gemmatimonadaceae bacterium]|nr:FtsX-like permease family protein [Gemmatimonadaceae bacterium]
MSETKRLQRLMAIAWRESRTARRRLLLYMSSISLGVSALVAIDSFTDNVSRSVREQSRALLGGDVSLSARDRYSAKATTLLDSLATAGVGVTHVTTFASMGLVPRSGLTRLVQVRAVSARYPFYGEITTEPAGAWARLQSGRHAIVDPSLLVSLDAQLGDTLMLGTARFVILATLRSVPGDLGVSAAIGPRIYIPDAYLGETGLLVFGSRAEYETLLKMPPSLSPARFAGRFNVRFSTDTPRVRLRTVAENEFNLTQSIDQLGDFLGIVGLVALLLGGIGVASGVHAFVMRKIDTVAVLRCLGATSGQVLFIYVLQALAMGLVGALAGAVLGVGFQFALPWALKDFLPVDVNVTLAPMAIGLGLGIGVWVALIFSLRPLLSLRRISPLQTLRRESDADVMRRAQRDSAAMVVSFAIVASVLVIALTRAGTVERAISYAAAIAGAIGLLWIAAVLLSRAAKQFTRPAWPFVLRQGVANLYRPGNQTRAVILSLGFGVFLMSTLYQVQRNLLNQLDLKLEQSRANVVFFDVQEDQAQAVDSLIRAAGHRVVQEAPIVPMRIAAINGRSVSQIMADADNAAKAARARGERLTGARRGPSSWALRREFRSTFRGEQMPSEKLVSGKWFAANDRTPQISLERELASELHVALGDTITWNVQGVRIPTVVTSTREVTWARFEPNFFVVFSPGTIEKAPKQYAILAHVPTSAAIAALQRSVVLRYPNVSSLDLSLIQRTISNVIGKVTSAIRFMAIVSLAFGIPVLFSAVAATRRERLREGVLLKTLGATRRQVGRIMLAEYALLGALGSLTGVVLSVGGAWLLMKFVFETSFTPAIAPVLLVGAAMTALAIAIGLATGREVFRQTPMAALREA